MLVLNNIPDNGTNFGLNYLENQTKFNQTKFFKHSSELCKISTFNCFFLGSVI